MNIVIKKAGEQHETKVIEKLELEDMQAMVGGFIECMYVGNGVDLWLNDEGKIYDLPSNIVIGSQDKEVLDIVKGDVFFAGSDGEDTVGLTDEQLKWVDGKLNSGAFALGKTEKGLEFLPVWVYDANLS